MVAIIVEANNIISGIVVPAGGQRHGFFLKTCVAIYFVNF